MPSNVDGSTPVVVRRILEQYYGLSVQAVKPPQKGYRNTSYPAVLADGTIANLIIYKSEPGILARITNANRVSDALWEADFPARHTLDSRIVWMNGAKKLRYASLYAYLPGQTIPWEAYTAAHIKLLGKTLSDMHALLRNFDVQELPSVTEEYLAILQRMQRYFENPDVQTAMASKLGVNIHRSHLQHCQNILRVCQQLPGGQPLHMDFVRGNLLFDDVEGTLKLTGVLDFEKTAWGHPIYDIARTLAFLLVDCKRKTPQQIRKLFLRSGYARRGRARLQRPIIATHKRRIDLIEELIDVFLLYDFYKFLRHNPYEFLRQNQHFIRTRDILVKRGLITTPLP